MSATIELLEPIDRPRLRPSLVSILTDHTCGEACWHAKEEICRCSCGGKNHGCLKSDGGEQPLRTCKIDGERYELAGVGFHRDLYKAAQGINNGNWRQVDDRMPSHPYHYHWRETDSGAPARLKSAPPVAVEKWPELLAYRDHPEVLARRQGVYCLWRRISPVASPRCRGNCAKCSEKYGI